jgi:hypothetical protein
VDRFFEYRSMVGTHEPADSLSFLPSRMGEWGLRGWETMQPSEKALESAKMWLRRKVFSVSGANLKAFLASFRH